MEALSSEKQALITDEMLRLVAGIARQVLAGLPPQFEFEDLVASGRLGLVQAAIRYRDRGIPFQCYARYRIRGAMIDSIRCWRYRDATAERLTDGPSKEADLNQAITYRETAVQVRAAIGELPQREARIVRERYLEERSLGEIAADLGMGRSYVSRLHRRGLAHLSTLLPADCDCTGGTVQVPKLLAIDQKRKKNPSERAKIVDGLGKLRERLEPLRALEKALVDEVRSWANAKYSDSQAVVFEGRSYAAAISARADKRRIGSMLKLFVMLGKEKFLSLCGFTLEVADKHLTPAQLDQVVVKEPNIGERTVKTMRRAGTKAA